MEFLALFGGNRDFLYKVKISFMHSIFCEVDTKIAIIFPLLIVIGSQEKKKVFYCYTGGFAATKL